MLVKAEDGLTRLRSSLTGANRVFAPVIVLIAVPSALFMLSVQLADGQFDWRWTLLALSVLLGVVRMYGPMYSWLELDHATLRTKNFWTRQEHIYRLEDLLDIRTRSWRGQQSFDIRMLGRWQVIRVRPDDMSDAGQLLEAIERLRAGVS